jgi:hypothetical protein
MPFGVVGTSPIMTAVEQTSSLRTTTYANEGDATQAVERGEIYGAYVVGSSGDTLLLAPAKSFFAAIDLQALFEAIDRSSAPPLTIQTVVPLPQSDRVGAVAGLLLLPTLIGGYMVATLLLGATGTAAQPRRIAALLGYAVLAAVLVDIIAGPIIGAVSSDRFWPLLPCLVLVTAAVSLATGAIQGVAGKLGTAIVVIAFIVVGGAGAGGVGVSMLPSLWQDIGVLFPPRHAVELYRNVMYFGGNNVILPIVVLGLYALAGALVILNLERIHAATGRAAAKPPTAAVATPPTHVSAPTSTEPAQTTPPKPSPGRKVAFAIVLAAMMAVLFAANYTTSGHEPVATNMPFGVTGQSEIVDRVQTQYSLAITQFPDEAAVKQAMDRTDIWAALIPGESSSELLVVPSISDLSPLDLAVQFKSAAAELGQTITVRLYTPVPLAPNDPIALVASILLTPLLVGGYAGAALLAGAAGAAGRWHGVILVGYALVAGLVVDVIGVVLLQGLPIASFWVVWPIMSLIVLVVALIAAVLRRLIGPLGIIATVIVVLQFGNPSSGGANGVPYLPAFWSELGPFLPPRNAYLLLRNTVYFNGNAIQQALIVLLVYVVIFGVVLFLLDRRSAAGLGLLSDEEGQAAAAAAAPVGGPI